MTMQPAGEHHTPSPLTFNDILSRAASATPAARIGDIRIALEAAYPTIRQQVAEEIAVLTEAGMHAKCASGHYATCDVCHALKNVALRAREIGGAE